MKRAYRGIALAAACTGIALVALRIRSASSDRASTALVPSTELGARSAEPEGDGEAMAQPQRAAEFAEVESATRPASAASSERSIPVELRASRGATIEGVVVWPDGSAAAGAQLEIVLQDLPASSTSPSAAAIDASSRWNTDEQGRFRLTGLGEGSFGLLASSYPEDEAPASQRRVEKAPWRARAESVRSGTSGLRLVLDPGSSLSGRVVDETRAPVERFQVHAQPVGALCLWTHDVWLDVVSAEGGFTLDGLDRGSWIVTATPRTREHAASSALVVELPQLAAIVLVAPRRAVVVGRAIGPRGEAVAHALVSASRRDARRLDGAFVEETPAEARTREDGSFALEALAPGRYGLAASASGRPPSGSVELVLGAGESISDVVLHFPEGARLEGSLHPDESNRGQRTVRATRVGERDGVDVHTDVDGRFEIDALAPGSYRVELLPDTSSTRRRGPFARFAGDAQRVVLAGGRTTRVVLGGPPPGAVRVLGRVLDGAQPLANTSLAWTAEGDHRASARTSDAGEFEIELDEPGAWTVLVGEEGDASELQVTIPDARRHRCDLELPSASISGVVTSAAEAPIAGVEVRLERIPKGEDEARHARAARTDERGRYEFRRLAGGLYVLEVGGRADPRYGYRHASFDLGEGEQQAGCDFRLLPGGTIEGRVVDRCGAPVARARVWLLDANGDWGADCDADGRFRIEGAPAGRVLLRPRLESRAGSDLDVQLPAGVTVDVVLSIDD